MMLKKHVLPYMMITFIALIISACNENIDIFDVAGLDSTGDLSKLIDKGVDINQRDKDGETPLMAAIRFDNLDNAKLLLSKNAQVNLKNKDGKTAINLVGSLGLSEKTSEIIKLLVAKGSDINHQDNEGTTALGSATLSGKPAIVKALLENGANPNIVDNNGSTPIWSVCIIPNIKDAKMITDLLVSHGANINTKDNQGDTLASYKYCTSRKELFAHFKEKGLK